MIKNAKMDINVIKTDIATRSLLQSKLHKVVVAIKPFPIASEIVLHFAYLKLVQLTDAWVYNARTPMTVNQVFNAERMTPRKKSAISPLSLPLLQLSSLVLHLSSVDS
jgi:hypothetical protein